LIDEKLVTLILNRQAFNLKFQIFFLFKKVEEKLSQEKDHRFTKAFIISKNIEKELVNIPEVDKNLHLRILYLKRVYYQT